MANIPEKIMKQRLRLQLQSLDSPSELPGSYRSGSSYRPYLFLLPEAPTAILRSYSYLYQKCLPKAPIPPSPQIEP